jgi:hypothetical protein
VPRGRRSPPVPSRPGRLLAAVPRTPYARDGLTVHERQIAELAGAGFSNGEIGERLFSPTGPSDLTSTRASPSWGSQSRAQLRAALEPGRHDGHRELVRQPNECYGGDKGVARQADKLTTAFSKHSSGAGTGRRALRRRCTRPPHAGEDTNAIVRVAAIRSLKPPRAEWVSEAIHIRRKTSRVGFERCNVAP